MPSPPKLSVLTFGLEDQTFALPLARVIEISLRVHCSPLPEVSPPIVGVAAHRGRLVPVVDLAVRLLGHAITPRMTDHFVFARTATRDVALVVQRTRDVSSVDREAMSGVPQSAALALGLTQTADGTVLIVDLDAVLSLEAERSFDDAVREREAGARPGHA